MTERTPEGPDRSGRHSYDREPEPGKPQEDVEDRPNVSTVTPEDYPSDQRARGDFADKG